MDKKINSEIEPANDAKVWGKAGKLLAVLNFPVEDMLGDKTKKLIINLTCKLLMVLCVAILSYGGWMTYSGCMAYRDLVSTFGMKELGDMGYMVLWIAIGVGMATVVLFSIVFLGYISLRKIQEDSNRWDAKSPEQGADTHCID